MSRESYRGDQAATLLLGLKQLGVSDDLISRVYSDLHARSQAPSRLLVSGEVQLSESEFAARHRDAHGDVLSVLPRVHTYLTRAALPSPCMLRRLALDTSMLMADRYRIHMASGFRPVPPKAFATTLAPIWTVCGHMNPVFCLKFSIDGTLLLSGGDDGIVKLWDVTRGMLITTLKGHILEPSNVSVITEIDISPSNAFAASCAGGEAHVMLYPLAPPPARQSVQYAGIPLLGHTAQANLVQFAPNGIDGRETLISVGDDGLVIAWDVEAALTAVFSTTSEFEPEYTVLASVTNSDGAPVEISWLDFCPTPTTPDAPQICITCADGAIYVITRTDARGQGQWRVRRVASFVREGVVSIYSPDGMTIAAASDRVLSLVPARPSRSTSSSSSTGWSVDLSTLPATGPVKNATGSTVSINNVRFVASGRFIAVSAVQEAPRQRIGDHKMIGLVYLVNTATGAVRHSFMATKGNTPPIVAEAVGCIIVGGPDGLIRTIDPASPAAPPLTYPLLSFNSFSGPAVGPSASISPSVYVAITHVEACPTRPLLAFANGEGQMILMGPKETRRRYHGLPQEQFFEGDYGYLARDDAGWCVDVDTALPPHMIKHRRLCNAEFTPYEDGPVPYHAQQVSCFTEFLAGGRVAPIETDYYWHVNDYVTGSTTRPGLPGAPPLTELPKCIVRPALEIEEVVARERRQLRERAARRPVSSRRVLRSRGDEEAVVSSGSESERDREGRRRVAMAARRARANRRAGFESDQPDFSADDTDSESSDEDVPMHSDGPSTISDTEDPFDPALYKPFYRLGCGSAPEIGWPARMSVPLMSAADRDRLAAIQATSFNYLNSPAPLDGLHIFYREELVIYSSAAHRRYVEELSFLNIGYESDVALAQLPISDDISFPARIVDIAAEYHMGPVQKNYGSRKAVAVQTMELRPILPLDVASIQFLRGWRLWPQYCRMLGTTDEEVVELLQQIMDRQAETHPFPTVPFPAFPAVFPPWARRIAPLIGHRVRLTVVPEVQFAGYSGPPLVPMVAMTDSVTDLTRGLGYTAYLPTKIKVVISPLGPDKELTDDSGNDSGTDSEAENEYKVPRQGKSRRKWVCRAVDYADLDPETDGPTVIERFDVMHAAQALDVPYPIGKRAGAAFVGVVEPIAFMDLNQLMNVVILPDTAADIADDDDEEDAPLPVPATSIILNKVIGPIDTDPESVRRTLDEIIDSGRFNNSMEVSHTIPELPVQAFELIAGDELDVTSDFEDYLPDQPAKRRGGRRKKSDRATCNLIVSLPNTDDNFADTTPGGSANVGVSRLVARVSLGLKAIEATDDSLQQSLEAALNSRRTALPIDRTRPTQPTLPRSTLPQPARTRAAEAIVALCQEVSFGSRLPELICDPSPLDQYRDDIPDPVFVVLVVRRFISGWYNAIQQVQTDLDSMAVNPTIFKEDADLGKVGRGLQERIIEAVGPLFRVRK